MTEFDDAYWRAQAKKLDVSDDVRHVEFAKFIADHEGNRVRYFPGVGWHVWNGRVWDSADDDTPALQAITEAASALLQRAANHAGDSRWAALAASKMLVSGVRWGIVKEMQALPELRGDVDELDQHRHLLTFRNGTVDLRTGELRPHDPADMMTTMAPVDYNPDAECPRFERFVTEVFPGDEELQRYFQEFLGYCLTGETLEQKLAVWFGHQGRNGKGATIRALINVFGKGLVQDIPFGVFEARQSRQVHTEVIAGLRSARMLVAQEGSQGAQMDVARLKGWSGEDRISARHLYGKSFSFQPRFKIVLATNFQPEFAEGGAPLWARTHSVLFGQHFVGEKVDRKMEQTFREQEREGIAAWVVRGSVAYYRRGELFEPATVQDAKREHQQEVDPLRPLLGEVFDFRAGHEVKRSLFNAELKQWKDANGENGAKFSAQQVKKHLLTHGVTEKQVRGQGWHYVGVYLMSDPPSPIEPQPSGGPVRVLPTTA